jgi:chromosome partitioning protein
VGRPDVGRLKSRDVPADLREGRRVAVRKIAVTNLKGGSSKTTTATALAVGLARRGRRTLLVDADSQGNASWTLLGGQGASPPTLATVLTRGCAAEDAVRPTAVDGLDLLPADASLGGVAVRLAQEIARDTRLRSALAPLEGRYEYVLFDTAPTFTTVTANVLVAAAEVLVPLDPGVYAVLGLVELENIVAEVRDAYNPGLHVAGLLLTKTARNKVCADVEAELRKRYGPLVYRVTVPASVKFEEAATRGTTVLDHAPKSPGAVAYTALVEEVVRHGQRAKDRGREPVVGGPGVDAA